MTQATDGGAPAATADGQSTAALVQHASEQVTRLVRDELALARAELMAKGRHAGFGAGLLAGGAMVALYALAVLVLAAVLGLAVVLPGWLAALIVGVVLLVLAVGLALVGRAQVRRAVPAMPQAAASSMRADLAAVSTAMRNRSRS